jgi:glycosyltransferase involved in cell wall biosynthesis
MGTNEKLHLLFAAFMAGGNATILQNLENEIKYKNNVDSRWLRIEVDPKRLTHYGEKRSFLIPGTIRNSFVTSQLIRKHEKSGIVFDAAYFFQHTICIGLWRFRNRVPYVIAMDGTPMFFAKNELWYGHPYFDPKNTIAKAKHILTRSVYRKAFHLLPLSTKVRDSLIDDYQIPPEKITVVPPGIDLHKFYFLDRNTEDRSKKNFNILFVGADFLRKGGDILASIATQPEFQDVQFNFVTKSYSGPTISNITVYDSISTNTDPMVKLLHEADIFVLPTRADSFSIASLEAMATGLPVITVPMGGIADIVEEGETGYLIPKDDIQSLIDRIRILRDNRQLRYRMGTNGRKRAESRFNIEAISNTVVDILQRAAAWKSSGH